MTRTADPFDELAALFLSEPESASTAEAVIPAQAGTAVPCVELVLVGHLPVRAGVWIGPYADHVAKSQGPTALLRLEDDAPRVEIFAAGASLNGASHLPVREGIARLGGAAPHWMIRPSPQASPEELVSAGADRITILSSADDAAVVAAYQIIRGLADAARAGSHRLPLVGIAVLGATEERARQMIERINRTAATFLGIELPLIACMRQIDAIANPPQLIELQVNAPLRLNELIEWIDAAREAEPDVPPSDPEAMRVAQPAETKRHMREPAPAAMPSPRAPEPVRLPPRPAQRIEPKPTSPQRQRNRYGAPLPLTAHVAGLSALPVRCPGHERVELAVDENGRMHLIAWAEDLEALWTVRSWSRSHRELLALACREHRFAPAGEAICHVFTSQPASVAPLHGTELHLHVLAPLRVGEQTAWYAAALTAAAE